MAILGFASFFPGMGSVCGELKGASRLTQCAQAVSRQNFLDMTADGMAPAVIGKRSSSFAEQLEAGTGEDGAVVWRNCGGCAFLCAAHESKCQVCGTQNSFQTGCVRLGSDHDAGALQAKSKAGAETGISEVTSFLVRTSSLGCSPALAQKSLEPSDTRVDISLLDMDLQDHMCDDASESTSVSDGELGEDTESEDEFIPDCMESAPPPGTFVQVLHDDGEWYVAEILTESGAEARVRLENGQHETLQFDSHVVRLADLTDDEDVDACDSVSEEEDGVLDAAPPVGTFVQVLYDDGVWHPARVTAAHGARATVVIGGQEEELDFDEDVVRLINFECIGDDEVNERD